MPSQTEKLRLLRRPPIGLGLPSDRRSGWNAFLALLIHVGILALLIKVAPLRHLDYQPNEGAPGSPAGGGGGGGGAIRLVALPALARAAVPPAVVPPPPPVPIVEPVIRPVEAPAPTPLPDTLPVRPDPGTVSGSGTGAGAGTGSGKGTGSGSGSGSGDGSGTGSGKGPGGGEGGLARPPEPRQLILPPPEIPKALRGVTISVTFMVGPEGRVEDIRLSPEPQDRGFARKLEDVMRNYRFRPARGPDGLPVAGTITVELTF